eukprot:521634-Amphidinium_carterae.1
MSYFSIFGTATLSVTVAIVYWSMCVFSLCLRPSPDKLYIQGALRQFPLGANYVIRMKFNEQAI